MAFLDIVVVVKGLNMWNKGFFQIVKPEVK